MTGQVSWISHVLGTWEIRSQESIHGATSASPTLKSQTRTTRRSSSIRRQGSRAQRAPITIFPLDAYFIFNTTLSAQGSLAFASQ